MNIKVQPINLDTDKAKRMAYIALLKQKYEVLSEKFNPTAKDMLDYIKIKATFEQKNINPEIKYDNDYEVYLTLFIRELENADNDYKRDYKALYIAKLCRDQMFVYPDADFKDKEAYAGALRRQLYHVQFDKSFSMDKQTLDSDTLDTLHLDLAIEQFYLEEEILATTMKQYTETEAEAEIMRKAARYDLIISLLEKKKNLLSERISYIKNPIKRDKDSDNRAIDIRDKEIDTQLEIFRLEVGIESKKAFRDAWVKRKDIKDQY